MEKLIYNLKRLNNTGGLLLIDYPTGVGKTYEAVEYILNNWEKENIFFITPLKKNLNDAFKELKGKIPEDKIELFKRKSILLRANAEAVIENIDITYGISNPLLESNEFRELKTYIDAYKTSKLDSLYKIVCECEKKFRTKVELYLRDSFKSEADRLSYVKSSMQWLIKLYPAILSSTKSIFFMTLDKFIAGNSTIVLPTYKFIDSSIVKNALIFIDEFDSTKNRILDSIIDNYLDNRINLFSVFTTAKAKLHNRFPKKLFKPSGKSEYDESYYYGIIEKNRKIFDDISNLYSLDYYLKNRENKIVNTIFNDQSYISISDNPYDKLYLTKDNDDSYNYISRIKLNDISLSFNEMLGRVKGAVHHLLRGISFLAINYHQAVSENGDFDLQEAVIQVLEMFGLNTYQIRSRILYNITSFTASKRLNISDLFELDFYKNGFRFYEFSEHEVSSLETKVGYFELNDSPENFMVNLCTKAYVVGLSATGTLDTVLSNYDLKYLYKRLGDRFYKYTPEDTIRIKEHIKNRLDKNKASTEARIIDANDQEVVSLFKEEEFSKALISELNSYSLQFDVNSREFQKNRIVKILLAINDFINNPKQKVFLSLTNKFIDIYTKPIAKYIELMKYENGEDYFNNFDFISLNSSSFDVQKEKYLKSIRDGKRVILLSTYQALGVGQNLHYEINGIKMDITSLYLEKPTNLIVDINKLHNDSYEELMKYIFQLESLCRNGEITNYQAHDLIRNAFYYKAGKHKSFKNDTYNTKSFELAAITLLIQAVGRICRTRDIKLEKVIYVDKEIIDRLDFSVVKNKSLNSEFVAIMDKQAMIRNTVNSEDCDSFIIAANNNQNIERKLAFDAMYEWSNERIEAWENLREFVLKNPTISSEDLEKNPSFNDYYVNFSEKRNEYYFIQDKNFKYITFLKDKQTGTKVVSQAECRLDMLMKVGLIKEYFIMHGYKVSFDSKNNLLIPCIYNNIYKGALGEASGLAILSHFGIILDKIDDVDKYEKFDFHINNLYFDFKLWKNSENDIDLEHIKNKLKRISGSKGIIINVLGDNNRLYKEIDDVIVIPSLIDENTLEINVKMIYLIRKIIGEFGGR